MKKIKIKTYKFIAFFAALTITVQAFYPLIPFLPSFGKKEIVSANEDILATGEKEKVMFTNVNPEFKVEFGNKEAIDKPFMRFESIASGDNPFAKEENEKIKPGIIERLVSSVFEEKKQGVELALLSAGVNLEAKAEPNVSLENATPKTSDNQVLNSNVNNNSNDNVSGGVTENKNSAVKNDNANTEKTESSVSNNLNVLLSTEKEKPEEVKNVEWESTTPRAESNDSQQSATPSEPTISNRKSPEVIEAEAEIQAEEKILEQMERELDNMINDVDWKLSSNEELAQKKANLKKEILADLTREEEAKAQTVVEKVGISVTSQEGGGSKDIIKNTNFVPGVDAEYSIKEGEGVKEEIVIKNSEGFSRKCLEEKINDPSKDCSLPKNVYTFSLKLDADVKMKHAIGVMNEKNPQGVTYFEDSKGKYLFHFEPLFAVDAKKVKTDAVRMEITGGEDQTYELKVIVDPSWLLSPERAFPVRIDPSIVHNTKVQFDAGSALNRVETTSDPKIQEKNLQSNADAHTVGLWHMNETSGTTVNDSSGKGNNGTATGTTIVDGKMGKARSFNGTTSDYINLGTTPLTTGATTISMWVKKRSADLRYTADLLVGGAGLLLWTVADGSIGMGFRGYTLAYTSSKVADAINTWYHISYVYNNGDKNSTSSYKIYVNGIEQPLLAGGVHGSATTTNFIGREINNTGPFNGLIDEVKISDIALTPEQIKADYSKTAWAHYTSSVLDLSADIQSIDSLQWSESSVSTGDAETPYSSTGLVGHWKFNYEVLGNNINTVDSTGNVGMYTSVGLGSDGFARISYHGNTDQFKLKFIQCTNADCSTKNINTINPLGAVGQYNSLALGSDGFARISYYDYVNKDLKFAQCTNADCSTQNISTIDSTGDVGMNTSIALGSDGFARISYRDLTNQDLKFAQCTNADCSTKNITVVDPDGENASNSMVLGSDGFARISYYDSAGVNLNLKFIQCTNADCSTKNITTVDSTGDVGSDSSLALGSDGFARISYRDGTNQDLKFVQCTNASCSTKNIATVDSTGDVGGYTSIDLGSDGFARISYYDWTNGDLKFVQCTNASCSTNTNITTATDSSGNGNNGTLTNFSNTTGQDMVAGSGWTANNAKWPRSAPKALMFDGSDDYVNMQDSSLWNIGSNNYTINMWVNPTQISSNGGRLISSWNGGSSNYGTSQYIFSIYNTGQITGDFGNGTGWNGAGISTSTGIISTGKWYNIQFVFNTSTINIYVNGTLQATSNRLTLQNSTKLRIGSWDWDLTYGGVNRNFNGTIDNVQIYNRALSADEILANYNATNIEFQTRTGATSNPNDGSWEAWKPSTSESQIDSMDNYLPTGCTGGTVLDNGRIHMFTSSGTFSCSSSGKVEVLVVAGGGGGGMDMGGGGGGGGVINEKDYTITAGTPVSVTVGNGGAGAPAASTNGQPSTHQFTIPANNGENSVFGSLTAIGGGRGGSSYYGHTLGGTPSSGGSGGGASGYSDGSIRAGGAGTDGQGHKGGQGGGQYYSGGGGGGGLPGVNSTGLPHGGDGYLSDILGPNYYWAGGGGGSGYSACGGNGGAGGGGGGAVCSTSGGSGFNNGMGGGDGSINAQTNRPGGNGGANTGGGGGGGSHYRTNNKGGDGGSGIVIVRLSPFKKNSVIKAEGTASQKTSNYPSEIDENTVGLWHLDETGGSGAYLKNSVPYNYTTFSYTGADQTYTVPAGITSIRVKMWGGGGGGGHPGGWSYGFPGGGGGYTTGKMAVTPGQNLTIMVGAGGTNGSIANTSPNYGGGARSCNTGSDCRYGGQGGGRSAIRVSGVDYLTAGGGGGGGSSRAGDGQHGGAGGGSIGNTGSSYTSGAGGRGGTISAGGAGGVAANASGSAGSQYAGGNPASNAYGGSGGGGYFGGGGGGYGEPNDMGGGGGGSGYVGGTGITDASSISGISNIQGNSGDPLNGGAGAGGAASTNGTAGKVVIITENGPINNGTPTGTTLVNGIAGKARSFAGNSSSIITVPDNETFTFGTGDFSVETWVNPSVITGNYEGIMGTYTGDGFMLTTSYGTDGHIGWWNVTNGWIDTNTSLSLNKWQHLAVTRTSGQINIYKDGVLINTTNGWTGNINGGNLIIGGWHTSYAYLTGSLDEIRITKGVARTPEEITESYRMGRDHRISRTFSSTDLSSKTKMPFWVAGDRPGTYMEATVGESAFANGEPDANTVGLWHLDEQSGSGAYFKDASINGSNGSIGGGSPTFTQGKLGKARNFNGGSSDYIDTGYKVKAGARSYFIWIKYNSLTGTGGYSLTGTQETGAYTYIGIQDGGQGYFYAGNNGGTFNQTFATNQWYHVGFTMDGTNTTKIYVNGSQVDTKTYSGDTNATKNFLIGRVDAGHYVNGTIDEVRVDNIARTAAEIRQAYEVGLRTHPITVEFNAKLDAGNLIANSGDLSFTIDTTASGSYLNKGENLYQGDKIIIKENFDGTEYLAQGTVTSVDTTTGAVTVASWDSGSTFPSAGFTANATVFKWQQEWMDLTAPLTSQVNGVNRLTLRCTDGNEGRNIFLDDFKVGGPYLTTPNATGNVTSTKNRYMQYRAMFSTADGNVTPALTGATVNYSNGPSSTDVLMRHGRWFDSSGTLKPHWWGR